MDKMEFLESPSVKDFVKWLGLKLDNLSHLFMYTQ